MGWTVKGLGRSAWPLALAGAMACATDGAPGSGRQQSEPEVSPVEQPAAAGSEVDLAVSSQRDELAGLRFPAPRRARTTLRHFDSALPATKIRHEIRVEPVDHAEVRIDVWDDPEGLAVSDWFDRHLAFLRQGAERVEPSRMTRADLPGLLVDHPRSPQSLARRTAVVSTGQRVFVVTCVDADDPLSHALFLRMVRDLAPDEVVAAEEVTP